MLFTYRITRKGVLVCLCRQVRLYIYIGGLTYGLKKIRYINYTT